MREHLYIFETVLLKVYSHLVVKWRVLQYSRLPHGSQKKIIFILKILVYPLISSVLLAVFFAGLLWMAAMTRLDLSYAYPFIGLTFVLILLFSALFFNEPLTLYKVAGAVLIIAGVLVSSRSLKYSFDIEKNHRMKRNST